MLPPHRTAEIGLGQKSKCNSLQATTMQLHSKLLSALRLYLLLIPTIRRYTPNNRDHHHKILRLSISPRTIFFYGLSFSGLQHSIMKTNLLNGWDGGYIVECKNVCTTQFTCLTPDLCGLYTRRRIVVVVVARDSDLLASIFIEFARRRFCICCVDFRASTWADTGTAPNSRPTYRPQVLILDCRPLLEVQVGQTTEYTVIELARSSRIVV